jgi:hypothetical protein
MARPMLTMLSAITPSPTSGPCIIGYGSSPSRCGPSLSPNSDGRTRDLPASDFRAIATRYDKLARNFLAGVQLAAAMILLN